MKTIGTVLNLIEKAQERANKSPEGTGFAATNRRERYYNWGGGVTVGDLKEVYRVDVLKDGMSGDTVQLYHYGTLTAEVWIASEPVLIYTYGESKSDADSVNTFLNHFRIDTRYTYKPVNGGFMEVE